MKKFNHVLSILALLFGLFGFMSCSEAEQEPDGPEEGVIWDIAPICVNIQLVDDEGNNLLDPETEGNWVGEELYIGYKDEAYYTDWEYQGMESGSRALPIHFRGLIWTGGLPGADTKKSSLKFGEFSGTGQYEMSMVFAATSINTVFEFKFTHSLVWKDHKPHFYDHIIYNGKDYEGRTLKLTFPRTN